MVEEGARRAPNVLDVPLAVLEEKLTVLAADDFRFEADGGIGGVIRRGIGDVITF